MHHLYASVLILDYMQRKVAWGSYCERHAHNSDWKIAALAILRASALR
jgi:hypothetical protein